MKSKVQSPESKVQSQYTPGLVSGTQDFGLRTLDSELKTHDFRL